MEPFKMVTKISSRSWVVLKKKDVLKNIAKFTKNHLCQNLVLNTFRTLDFNSIQKKTLAQEFSCTFGEIFNNTFFTNHHCMAASVQARIIS